MRELLNVAASGRYKTLPFKYYFNGIECTQLAADAFNLAFTIICNREPSTLIVPVSTTHLVKELPVVFLFNGIHYDLYTVEERCVYPSINLMYKKIGMNIDGVTSDLSVIFNVTKYTEKKQSTSQEIVIID